MYRALSNRGPFRRPTTRSRPIVACGILCLLTEGLPAASVQLRHQLTPGTVCVYEARMEIERQGGDAAALQKVVRRGTLTRAVFADDRANLATAAQILLTCDDAPGGAPTRPASMPADRVPDHVQLLTAPVQSGQSRYLLPLGPTGVQQVLRTSMAEMIWPEQPVPVGRTTWTRPCRAGRLHGEQRYELGELQRKGSQQLARVIVTTELEEPEPARSGPKVNSVRAELLWSISERELVALDGLLRYQEQREGVDEEVAVRVTLDRTHRRRWTPLRRASEREALVEMTRAVMVYRVGDDEQLQRICSRFLRQYPTSTWRPMAEYLERQIEPHSEPLAIDALKQRLADLLGQWHQTELNDDSETREQLKREFARLMKVNRAEIVRLLDDDSAEFRAVACFALAFGETPADIARIQQACGDPAEHVRQWAMSALALRGSTLTSQDVLVAGLNDSDPVVRRRACQAIEACTSTDTPAAPDTVAALADRLDDDSADVIYAAAQALVRLGDDSRFDRIRQAAERCGNPVLAAALLRLLPPATQPGS